MAGYIHQKVPNLDASMSKWPRAPTGAQHLAENRTGQSELWHEDGSRGHGLLHVLRVRNIGGHLADITLQRSHMQCKLLAHVDDLPDASIRGDKQHFRAKRDVLCDIWCVLRVCTTT